MSRPRYTFETHLDTFFGRQARDIYATERRRSDLARRTFIGRCYSHTTVQHSASRDCKVRVDVENYLMDLIRNR